MEALAVAEGMMSLLSIPIGGPCLSEKIRILKDKSRDLRAWLDDLEAGKRMKVGRGKKRKQDDFYCVCRWITEGRMLLEVVGCLLRQVGEWKGVLMCAKIMNFVEKCINELSLHERKGHMLLRDGLPDERGPNPGHRIPVRELIGQVAVSMLEKLMVLLQDDEVGRIVVHGVKGSGKTILMKHLYNNELKLADFVFWVTSPDQFTIKHVQNAVAAAINCDLPSGDDLDVRATMLSDTLSGLGSCVLFIDDVPEAEFSLEEVGIPVVKDGSGCKLVLSTSSTLECKIFDCSVAVKLDCLPEEEAFELFVCEAGIIQGYVSSLGDIPKLLAVECCGVPRKVVEIATRMCGIDDPREWRNELFESRSLGTEKKPPFQIVINSLERDTKKMKMKMDVVLSSETTSNTHVT